VIAGESRYTAPDTHRGEWPSTPGKGTLPPSPATSPVSPSITEGVVQATSTGDQRSPYLSLSRGPRGECGFSVVSPSTVNCSPVAADTWAMASLRSLPASGGAPRLLTMTWMGRHGSYVTALAPRGW